MHAKPIFPWIFNLDGNFLGIVEDDSDRNQYIVLEVDEEPISIKYPESLCDRLKSQLQPGDRIQCIGRSQVDFLSKLVKLEAYQVWSIASTAHSTSAQSSPYTSTLAS